MRTRVLAFGLVLASLHAGDARAQADVGQLVYDLLNLPAEPRFETKTTLPAGPASLFGGFRTQTMVNVEAGSVPGTNVVTISSRNTAFAGVGARQGGRSAELSTSTGLDLRYQVTVSDDQLAAIRMGGALPNPFDPSTLAPGMELTLDLSMLAGVDGKTTLPIRQIPVIASLGMLDGYGRFVTLRRLDGDQLEVTAGQSAFVQSAPRIGVGIRQVNLAFGGDDRILQRSGDRWTIDLASFNGIATFRDLLQGTLPPGAPERVTTFSNTNGVVLNGTFRSAQWTLPIATVDRGSIRVVERADGSAVVDMQIREGQLRKRIEIPADGGAPTTLYTWTAAIPAGFEARDFLEPFSGRSGTGLRAYAVEGVRTIVFTFTEAELLAMAALVNPSDHTMGPLREGNVLFLVNEPARMMSAFLTLYQRNGRRPLPWRADFGVVVPFNARWSPALAGVNAGRADETRPGAEQQLVDAQGTPDPSFGVGITR